MPPPMITEPWELPKAQDVLVLVHKHPRPTVTGCVECSVVSAVQLIWLLVKSPICMRTRKWLLRKGVNGRISRICMADRREGLAGAVSHIRLWLSTLSK